MASLDSDVLKVLFAVRLCDGKRTWALGRFVAPFKADPSQRSIMQSVIPWSLHFMQGTIAGESEFKGPESNPQTLCVLRVPSPLAYYTVMAPGPSTRQDLVSLVCWSEGILLMASLHFQFYRQEKRLRLIAISLKSKMVLSSHCGVGGSVS